MRWPPALSTRPIDATTTMEMNGACRPHLIEVVHLGRRAVAVCHDCRRDSGFLPEREADRLAYAHRQETDGDEYSIFSSWVA